jgi:hypothetical protein
MSILNIQVRVAILRPTKSKCGNARYIHNTFAPPFHVHPEATFAGKSAKQPSECRLCLLLLRGVKMDGFVLLPSASYATAVMWSFGSPALL